ncbi:SPARC-related modular calcium-binding protein 1 isoform X3 [Corythoichthys intestinalis]|uniref:SPARC-related modular calcium-binding protein 1 isoform X3 n=1 Tax=Corythoichthys intestinalis TaxID=161448 RepID=UPI0025A56866|nr:SPARC-related modular calcium-binding protein 1 isoform X3 [Corythoichthys intestinalis]
MLSLRIVVVFVATTCCCHLMLFLCHLPRVHASHNKPANRWLIGDRDSQCGGACTRPQGKPVCGSDGRSYDNGCELQRARCKDKSLTLAHRGRCRGRNWTKVEQSAVALSPTPPSVGRESVQTDEGQSKCRVERNQALEQARRPQESMFVPECNEDGSFAQVQCHTLTGYCWCVTADGKPVSGSSVHNRTPVCSGSATDRPPGPANSGRKVSFRFFLTLNPDDGSKPTPTMETLVPPEGDEITAPTLWIKQLVYKENKQNSSTSRKQEKIPSCDQERQSALDEARQNPREAVFIPDCGPGGLYKAVQCHQSTGYCWCVLVDTGRPIPGTSTRYQTPECDNAALSRSSDTEDLFQGRDLTGCPEGKKVEFITSLLDALTTDMVQAINSPAPSGGGRFVEPDPTHTLEERVVHWYFAQLDANGSRDVGKKELKPFKRYLKKKAKPKKCARKFTDYCDLNKDKAISLHELKGCLGVGKDGGSTANGNYGTSRSSGVRGDRSRSRAEGRGHRRKASERSPDGEKKKDISERK